MSEPKLDFSREFKTLAKRSTRRGTDASGILLVDSKNIWCCSDTRDVEDLIRDRNRFNFQESKLKFGFSRMITQDEEINQPVLYEDIVVIHNGIIVNFNEIKKKCQIVDNRNLDSLAIAYLIKSALTHNLAVTEIANYVMGNCVGQVAAVCLIKSLNIVLLFSNNGSLYMGRKKRNWYVASEASFLEEIECETIETITDSVLLESNFTNKCLKEVHLTHKKESFVKEFNFNNDKYKLTDYVPPEIVRCSKCILPATFPFIEFNETGTCNYCLNYVEKNPKSDRIEDFIHKLSETSRERGVVLVPVSGGRDSTFTLDFVVKQLGLKAIAYTYDWGFVTDSARRNISKLCGALKVEHILIAKDLAIKRRNVRINLQAWLSQPDLGTINILTAGDKHFFKYADIVARETKALAQIWGVNGLEETHFKAGFIGIPPKFQNNGVYYRGALSQLQYQSKRAQRIMKNPKLFNRTLFDTLSGEYYRSVVPRKNYFHLFDYVSWGEARVSDVLNEYDWENSHDSSFSWRAGDATAPFYNYANYRIAGFTENDTFRSNQIREGLIPRSVALEIVERENKPRPASIKWYLDTVGIDFEMAIRRINATPTLYNAE